MIKDRDIRDIKEFSQRTINALVVGARLQTVGDIISLNRTSLLEVKGLGRRSFNEIRDFLDDAGLELQPDDSPPEKEHCNFCRKHMENCHKVGLQHICSSCFSELKIALEFNQTSRLSEIEKMIGLQAGVNSVLQGELRGIAGQVFELTPFLREIRDAKYTINQLRKRIITIEKKLNKKETHGTKQPCKG